MMSKIADKVYKYIKEEFPHLKCVTELYISHRGQRLFFDFHLPDLNLVIEVQGEQHYKFVPFFHTDARSFRTQRYRDQLKEEWCATNSKLLLKLCYKELETLTSEQFRNRVLEEVKGYNSGY